MVGFHSMFLIDASFLWQNFHINLSASGLGSANHGDNSDGPDNSRILTLDPVEAVIKIHPFASVL